MKHTKEDLEENPLQRWSRRKLTAEQDIDSHEFNNEQTLNSEPEPEKPALTDDDMPPIESLDENSDYSGFLSPEVSEGLRKLALRKLFHMPTFNIRDGLDDYDSDYTEFAKLGSLVTADMKHIAEVEAKRKLEQLAALNSDAQTEDAIEKQQEDDPVLLANTDESGEVSEDSEVDELESDES